MKTRTALIALACMAATQASPQTPRAPVAAVTKHTGTFNGETVKYTATVAETFIPGPDGAPAAVMINTAYVRDGVPDQTRRPVMFVFNGGPGASSSPLHMSAFGPRRRVRNEIVDNPFSPLDSMDLVFIDPIGTGFSRPLPGVDGQPFWSITGDGASVSKFIQSWLAGNRRESSPRFLCGESYGTIRAGQILETGHKNKGLSFDGVLLLSLAARLAGSEMPFVTTFPTFAVAAAFHGKVDAGGRSASEIFDEAAKFARTEYIGALIQGDALPAAEKTRIAQEMAKRIGLSEEFIAGKKLRIGKPDFMLNLLKGRGLRTGQLDSRATGELAAYANRKPPADDPSMSMPAPAAPDKAAAPSLLQTYFTRELKFPATENYRSLNLDINAKWKYDVENAFSDTAGRIAAVMREQPKLRLFWAAGYYDITTPLAAGKYTLDQAGIPPERLTAALFETGHSVFEGDENLARFTQAVRQFVKGGAAGSSAQPASGIKLEWTLRPEREAGPEVKAVAVRMEMTGAPQPGDKPFSLCSPIVYASRGGMADHVKNLEVKDSSGAVPLVVEDDPVNKGGFPYYRHWRATRPVSPPVVVTYRMGPNTGAPIPGPQFDYYAHGGGISAGGMALFVLPENVGPAISRVRWDLSDLAPGSIAASTYGEGEIELQKPPAQLAQAYYMAGPLGSYVPPGAPSGFRAYWLGQPNFEPRKEMAWAHQAYEYLRKFYRDSTTPVYRVFVRALPGAQRVMGGTALQNSFMVAVPAGAADPSAAAPRNTLAHEMGHMWVGGLTGRTQGGVTWFAEGLNVYYTRLLMLRAGLAGVDDYEKDINASARGYFTNPYRNESAESLDRLGFSTGIGAGSAQNVPYMRGSLYFSDVDAKIRAASGGRRKLDDVMLPLFDRRRKGEPLTKEDLIQALVKEIGPAARSEFEAVIVRGETIVPVSEAFGPCFERRPAKYEVQGKEVAGVEWVRVTAVPDDRCREW
ncbi:MAG: hypothetical protein ACE15B_15255 [Bryobacteraceae bacterium]